MMDIKEIPEGKQIILFDGVCNFCNSVVNKIIAADHKNVFVFASLQSEIGEKIKTHIGVQKEMDSILLYQPGIAYYVKSDAVLHIAAQLQGKYRLLEMGKVLPAFLRNSLYDYFAKNRYRWFGKQATCSVPTPEIKEKFL